MSGGASVIILPVVRVERRGEAPPRTAVQANLAPEDFAWLARIAEIYWDDDVSAAASALLAGEIARMRGRSQEGKV